MNRSIILTQILPLVATLGLGGCHRSPDKALDIDSMTQYIPIQTSPDGRWGLMSTDGQLLFEDEFTKEPTLTVNGVFSVGEDGAVSLYTPGVQPRLLGDCEGLSDAGFANEGRVPVARDNNRLTVVDTDGQQVFALEPVNGHEINGCARYFNNGRLVVYDDRGLYGTVDTQGATVIVPKYEYLSNYNEGYAIARLAKGHKKLQVIDVDDQTVCEVREGYSVVSTQVKEGEIVISDTTGLLALMTLKGEVQRLPSKVKRVGEYTEKLLTFSDANNRWGVMSRGEDTPVMVRPKFSSLTLLDDALMLVNLDDRWAVIDMDGRKHITFDDSYKTVMYTPVPGKIQFMAKDNAGWLALDKNGQELSLAFNIHDFNFRPTLDGGPLTSRLFDLEEFENNILKLITENSLAGIQLNSLANPWYADQRPEDLTDKSEFTPTKSIPGGYGYEIQVVGVTDRMITTALLDRTSREYRQIFTPNNTVYAIELIITSSISDIYGKSLDGMVKALEDMGFRTVEREAEAVTLRSRYANIELSPLDKDEGMSVLMYRL